MSHEFELVLIRVVDRTPIVPVLVNEQLVIDRKVTEEFLIHGVKKKDIHSGLLATRFCDSYSINHSSCEVNGKFKVF